MSTPSLGQEAATLIGQGAQEALIAGAPEVYVAQQAAAHAPSLLMMPLIMFSILIIIVSVILMSSMDSKIPGAMLMLFGFALSGGAFFVIERTETAKSR